MNQNKQGAASAAADRTPCHGENRFATGSAAEPEPDFSSQNDLTEREYEVLRLVAAGLTNRDIATALSIAESTVKTHVERIIGKLGVSDRVQAAVWATRQGVVEQNAP